MKKLILSILICVCVLFGALPAQAATIEYYDNVNYLMVVEVYADALNVRRSPTEYSDVIDVIHFGDEIECVAKFPGWAKICLGIGEYGYVNDYWIGYKCYDGSTAPILYSKPIYEEVEEYEESIYEEEYIAPEETYNVINQSADYYAEDYSYDYIEPEETYDDFEEDYEESYVEEDAETYEEYEEDYETYEEVDITYDDEEESYSTTGQDIVNTAQQYVGNPYVYGGNSLTDGIDCSGFTQQIFDQYGISLDRTAAAQSQGGEDVSLDELEAGDLLFYDNGGYIGHVAIYNGDGTVTHASNEETGITISEYGYRDAVSAKRYW